MHKVQRLIGVCCTISLLMVASIFKVNFIIGSHYAFFSCFDMLAPLAGVFGISSGLAMYTVRCLLGNWSWFSLCSHLPSLVGAWCLASNSRLKFLLPLVCMILFWVHPVGSQAWGYALLWVVPVVGTYFKGSHLFMRALGCTLTVHAVGSIIWLYTVSMSSEQWWALIPVVVVERLLFAGGLTVAIALITSITRAISDNNMIPSSIPESQILTKGSL